MATKGEPVSKGFAVGLQIWLLFLISFYGLGYPALFSILLGAIGGLASGFIVDWWLTKDENIEPRKRRQDNDVEEQTRSRQRQRPHSALNHRKRRKEREPVTLKTVTKFFQRPQPESHDEES